uniref:Uncharacterized protein n=1 Tax=Micrurus lemniscatus lemniscatus TaxID=129467 RepID=A0A2D4IG40_MICLE
MAEDSESAASQQSLELDDQDTCGIDGDNEEETEHSKGSPGGELGAKKKKKKQKRKKEKTNSGGTKSDSASDSQEIKNQQPSKVRDWPLFSYPYFTLVISDHRNVFLNEIGFVN